MDLETFSFRDGAWSRPFPTGLDSDQTLVVVFAAPSFARDPSPIRDLAQALPRARLVGCSTAGEILGSRIYDESLSVGVVRFDRTRVKTAFVPVEGPCRSFEA